MILELRYGPHRVGTAEGVDTPGKVKEQWEQIKAQEKAAQGKAAGPAPVFKDSPPRLPSLMFAEAVWKQIEKPKTALANPSLVKEFVEQLGINVTLDRLDDPRIEAEEHYYNATHTRLLELGLQPHLLTDEVVAHLIQTIQRYKDRILLEPIAPKTRWDPRS